jgi:hypothetical protein
VSVMTSLQDLSLSEEDILSFDNVPNNDVQADPTIYVLGWYVPFEQTNQEPCDERKNG